MVSRLVSAGPATVTSEANARALNAVIGGLISVGMRIGNTTFALT